ncbi:related to transcriptional regulator [Ustilago trichophora]|uniref:Related to transcriptional regulator n=1 Tax=Ustilago trichophora TaxID=86804 RepID=A0A5C3DT34_9BASI|nr:related to transcriptional regulator [Ustilago trichophora]
MYLRPETVVNDWSQVEHFIRSNPLGLLTTSIPLSGQSTIQASHLPFLFTSPVETPCCSSELSNTLKNSVGGIWNQGDLGLLRCHLSRSNPQAKALLSRFNHQGNRNDAKIEKEEVLVIFSDPNNQFGYISPQWYKSTKPSSGKTVPTWNYSELQLYGHISLISPSEIVRHLSDTHEHLLAEKLGKNSNQQIWSLDDAPKSYIQVLERAIIGLEIKITKIGFKMKMSREKNEGDRKGVLEGLRGVPAEKGEGEAKVADLVERLGPMK